MDDAAVRQDGHRPYHVRDEAVDLSRGHQPGEVRPGLPECLPAVGHQVVHVESGLHRHRLQRLTEFLALAFVLGELPGNRFLGPRFNLRVGQQARQVPDELVRFRNLALEPRRLAAVRLQRLARHRRDFVQGGMGVPVSGPGARPYRRARLFTGLIEYLCAYIESPYPDLLHRVQVQLFHTIQQTEGVSRFDIWERSGRLSVMRMVGIGRELRERNASAIAWINAAAPAFTGILREHEFIGEQSAAVIEESASQIVADIRRNRDFDPDDLTVDDVGDFAHPDGSLRLLTLHSAKGREFDAVCIVELQEGQMPHPRGDIDESRRVLYVGVTRPRKVLMLCHRRGSTQSRFLAEPRFAAALDGSVAW